MDDTIHSQSTVTQNPSPYTEEKENNCVSETHQSETLINVNNELPLNSTSLNGDSLDKCELEHCSDKGDVLNVDSEQVVFKKCDDTIISDVERTAENQYQHTRENVELEASGTSNIPVENAAQVKPTASTSISNENLNENEETTTVKEEWMDILGSGQLKKKVLRAGTSSFRPSRSWLCQLSYEACLPDGKLVEKCENLNIQIGDGEVIEGLDLVLPLMDVGELALVEVASRFAYDSQGRGPDIPPNTTLMYKVELLSAHAEPELETIPAAERRKIGNSKRSYGNNWYERQKYTLAIHCYRRALEYLDEMVDEETGKVKESDEEAHSLLEDRLKVYNNMAAAQMKIEAYDAALTSVGHVLLCEPDNVKALYRKGKILRGMGNNSEAREVLTKANSLDPNSKIILKELQTVSQVCKVEARKEKDLYKKMFTKENSAGQPKNNGRQIPWGAVVGSVSAAAVAIIATLAAYKYKFI